MPPGIVMPPPPLEGSRVVCILLMKNKHRISLSHIYIAQELSKKRARKIEKESEQNNRRTRMKIFLSYKINLPKYT